MRAVLWLLLAALSGCAAITSVRSGGAVSGVVPGTSVSGASIGVHVESGSAAGALLGLGIVAAGIYGAHDGGAGDDSSVPELDPDRTVNVQDCREPIKDWSANLMCK
ncbi:MAG TPA: hypothetical protein VNF69_03960 [Burkholderiales bacterium]|nr:hypothetical protein [Burkholderiales bacterium]